jgi:multiple sugar transport system permease protein
VSTSSLPPGLARLSVSSPKRNVGRIFSTLALILISIGFVLPLAWIVLSSLNTAASVTLEVPKRFSLDNFRYVLTPQLTFIPIGNSLLIATTTALVAAAAAVLAAYPLSRYQMRFRQAFLYGVLFGTCLPITAIMVPVYSLFVSFHLLDSTIGVMLFMSASTLPMAIWMMKNFMDSVPISLEEAAWVDGASAMKSLVRIVTPLMAPGIAMVFVFVFAQTWGNFFVPFILFSTPAKEPAAVAIYQFFGNYGSVYYGRLAAFSLLYATPAVALYLIAQRVSGGNFAMAGAVKG